MSSFGKGHTINVFNKQQSFEITSGISKNKLKKQYNTNNGKNKKNGKINSNITDKEFESIMNRNKMSVSEKSDINNIKKYNIPELNHANISNHVKEILNKNLIGDELVYYLETNNNRPNGIELLEGILTEQLDKFADFTNIVNLNDLDIIWIQSDNYGRGLKYLFESNVRDQIVGLIMIQKFCSKLKFPKISFKNSSIFLIKILFQLFFTNDIFEEESYWNWQEYINDSNEFDDELKKILSIQTAEFFNILKTVFTDSDYVSDTVSDSMSDSVSNLKLESNPNHTNDNNLLKNKPKYNSNSNSESESELRDVPEEQDYNLDEMLEKI